MGVLSSRFRSMRLGSMRLGSMRFRSMRSRMTALFALLVALLMLGSGGAVQRRERGRAEARAQENLNVAIGRARDEISEKMRFEWSLLQIVRNDQGEIAAGGLTLLVADSAGKVLWQSRRKIPAWPRLGSDWRGRTLFYRGQTLVVAREWAPIEEELRETARALWQLGALVVGATALLAWFVVGQTLSPLHKLAAQAQNASIDTPQLRLHSPLHSPSSDDEMRHLTQTLNSLLGRLERQAQARGRFYAAASHELRTPIQVLMGEIDVARSRPRSVAQHEEVLAQIQESTERLATLVRDLLQLNALETGQNSAPRERLNLAFWVERACAQQCDALGARGLRFQCHLMETPIEAPPAHLEMLLRNLVENAVKYATPETAIEIELTHCPGETRFEIHNFCDLPAGIQPDDEWFEPFFRPDASRNSQTGGNGLGLAICRSICAANNWQLSLHAEREGVGSAVSFPHL